jgi:hypothetical protein
MMNHLVTEAYVDEIMVISDAVCRDKFFLDLLIIITLLHILPYTVSFVEERPCIPNVF